jgi:N6-adenosine-specific RNA methylase IME4
VKPAEFYDLVESLCPAPRYADIFSRYRHNDKWDCHGDEAPAQQRARA